MSNNKSFALSYAKDIVVAAMNNTDKKIPTIVAANQAVEIAKIFNSYMDN